MQTLFVPGKMPTLNEILDAKRTESNRASGKRWNKYNELKSLWHSRVDEAVKLCGVAPVGPSYFTFLIAEENQKRDPDGIVAGCMKVMFDGLKESGVIRGDGWRHVLGIAPYWDVAAAPGAWIFIDQERLLSRKSALEWLRE